MLVRKGLAAIVATGLMATCNYACLDVNIPNHTSRDGLSSDILQVTTESQSTGQANVPKPDTRSTSTLGHNSGGATHSIQPAGREFPEQAQAAIEVREEASVRTVSKDSFGSFVLSLMELARRRGEQRIKTVDYHGNPIVVDTIMDDALWEEVSRGIEDGSVVFDHGLWGFTKKQGDKLYILRSEYYIEQAADGNEETRLRHVWKRVYGTWDLTERGLGIVSLEGNEEELSQPSASRPAMNPRFNKDSSYFEEGMSSQFGDIDSFEHQEAPNYQAVAHFDPSYEIYEESVYMNKGISIEVEDFYDNTFAQNHGPGMVVNEASRTESDYGRMKVRQFYSRAILNGVDYTELFFNQYIVVDMQWLGRTPSANGLVAMLQDDQTPLVTRGSGNKAIFEPGIESAFAIFGVPEFRDTTQPLFIDLY